MHGYFLSLKLYTTARLIANPQSYAEYRDRVVSERLAAKAESRIRARKDLPKVNKALAERIRRTEKRDIPEGGVMEDPRFKEVFENPDFEVDEQSREFALLNPATADKNVRYQLTFDALLTQCRRSAKQLFKRRMRRVIGRRPGLGKTKKAPRDRKGETKEKMRTVRTAVMVVRLFAVLKPYTERSRSTTIRPSNRRAIQTVKSASASIWTATTSTSSHLRIRYELGTSTKARDIWFSTPSSADAGKITSA